MRDVYKSHTYLCQNPQFAKDDQLIFERIINQNGSPTELRKALVELCRWLKEYHQVDPWVLIDEYDTPIQTAYLHDYYDELIPLMQAVFGNTLKTNPHLNRAILTGITRVSKESLFSDLNNVAVYTLFNEEYSKHFGFTESEIEALLVEANLTAHRDDIKYWYNGYLCGDTILYNPWSIINCVTKKGALAPYWVHTGGTSMIQKLLAEADAGVKSAFEELLQGKSIEARISDHLVYGLFGADMDSVMSLLLAAGYLKATSRTQTENADWLCQLTIPNHEVMAVYRTCIMTWFVSQGQNARYEGILKDFAEGDAETVEAEMGLFLERTASYFDVSSQEPEKFYHGLVLGMVVSMAKTHAVESNRESGAGRYDVMLVPHDKTKHGVILEFKVVRPRETLETAAQNALTQIRTKNYAATLKQRGLTRILAIGLYFQGKQVHVKYEWLV